MTIMVSTRLDAAPVAVEIPRRVGNVRIGGVLGEGAGGAVLTGFDEVLGRKVAVKVLHRQVGSGGDAAASELAAGVRSAARIKHPNIVTIHAVETFNAMPVIVMEHVDGVSLGEVLKRTGALDVSLAMYVMRAITSAVAALHDADVLHRDLKPANILFDRAGEAHVCDFGMACDFDRARFAGSATNIGGSPLYMAPEMFEGNVSPQSDVYALGVIMIELLSGQAPFTADSISEMQAAHRKGKVPIERLERRNIDEDLCEIVRRAMRKERIMRYKTARHMLRAIERASSSATLENVQRLRMAEIVCAQPTSAASAGSTQILSTDGPPAMTTFDLLAQRARQKRDLRSQRPPAGR